MDGSSLNGEWQACSQCLSEHLDGDWVGLAVGLLGSVTCMWGRGRPRAEGLVAGRPTLLLSSSRARVSCSNCTSCSLTDSSRAAALSHCSIHTTRAPEGKGWWWWGGRGRGWVRWRGGGEGVTHTHPCRPQEHKSGCATKASTLHRDFICQRLSQCCDGEH